MAKKKKSKTILGMLEIKCMSYEDFADKFPTVEVLFPGLATQDELIKSRDQ